MPLKNPLEKGNRTARLGNFALSLSLSIHSSMTGKKSTDVPVQEKLLAVAMGILNRISSGI